MPKNGILKRQAKKKASKAQARKGKKHTRNDLPPNYEEQIEQLTTMIFAIIYGENSNLEEVQLPEAWEASQAEANTPDDAAALAVADVGLWVIDQVEQQLESQGRSVLPVVLFGLVGQTVSEVGELTIAAGVFPLTPEDIQVGISIAVNKFIALMKREGKVSDQELQEIAAAMEKKYPEEAQNFNTMIQERQARQETANV